MLHNFVETIHMAATVSAGEGDGGWIIFQPVFTDWVIPLLLLLVGILCKKLTRRKSGWIAEDLCVGPDLCLAAMGTGLLKTFDLLKNAPDSSGNLPQFRGELGLSILLVFCTFFGLVFVLSEYRDLIEVKARSKAQNVRLLGVCNLIGVALLTAFLIWIKPIR